MTLVGASLGGAIALDFAFEFPEAVKRLVLIDAQGYIDGSGPGASLPGPLAKLGISILGSKVLEYGHENAQKKSMVIAGRGTRLNVPPNAS